LQDLSSWSKQLKSKKAKRKDKTSSSSNSSSSSSAGGGGSGGSGGSGGGGGDKIDDSESLRNYVPPPRGRVEATIKKLGSDYSQPSRQLTKHVKGMSASGSGNGSGKKKKRRKKKKKKATLPQHAAGHTYDYFKDKWDKFDVDKALQEADESSEYSYETEEEDEVIEEIENPGLPPVRSRSQPPPPPAAEETKSRIQKVNSDLTPTQWKDKGNEYFRTSQYQRAVECYTGSIDAEATAVAYANRAMALLKLGEFDKAVEDSAEALKIDPFYLKAYQRRGTAHRELGLYLNALQDYEAALRLSPSSQALKVERIKLIDALCSKEGLEKLKSRVKIPVVDRRDSQQTKSEERQVMPTSTSVAAEEKRANGGAGYGAGENERGEAAKESPKLGKVEDSPTKQKDKGKPLPVSCPSPSTEKEWPVPRSAVEFEITWKSLKDDEGAKWTLLRKLDPRNIASLLKNMLTGPLFFAIIKCILTKMREQDTVEDAEHGVTLLESIAQTPRFKINVLSIPSKNRAEIKDVWEYHLESIHEQLKDRIAKLAKVYGASK